MIRLMGYFYILSLSLLFIACNSTQPVYEGNLVKSNSKIEHLSPDAEQIDFNSIIAQGQIHIQDGKSYFTVIKVLKRGRSAPHVLNKQVLPLKKINQQSTPTNTTLIGLLTCDTPQRESSCEWTFKINN